MHKYQKNNTAKSETEDDPITKLKEKAEDDEGSDASLVEEEKPAIDKKAKKKLVKEAPNLNFHNDDDSDEDDFLQVKQSNVSVDDTVVDQEEHKSKKKAKPLTKAAVAKKILKKKIKVNTTVKFTEDGEAIDNEKKDVKSELAKQFVNEDVGGIDIEMAKEVLKEEDKFDKIRFREKVKAKHKEQKRKLKEKRKEEQQEQDDFGSASESDGPDLSWLPDPDKVYSNKDDSEDEEKSEKDDDRIGSDSEQSDIESDEEKFHRYVEHIFFSHCVKYLYKIICLVQGFSNFWFHKPLLKFPDDGKFFYN